MEGLDKVVLAGCAEMVDGDFGAMTEVFECDGLDRRLIREVSSLYPTLGFFLYFFRTMYVRTLPIPVNPPVMAATFPTRS
jgi:hypothetical protein